MPVLYRSRDDGALYTEVDAPEDFDRVEVPEVVTLIPEQLCGTPDVGELLVRAGVARMLTD